MQLSHYKYTGVSDSKFQCLLVDMISTTKRDDDHPTKQVLYTSKQRLLTDWLLFRDAVRCMRGSNFRLLQCVQVATSGYCIVFRQQLQVTAVCSYSNFRLLHCVQAATSGYCSVFRQKLQVTAVCSCSNFRLLQCSGSNLRSLYCVHTATSGYCSVFRQQLQVTAVCSCSNFRLLQCVQAVT
jgi:hypothetical protein